MSSLVDPYIDALHWSVRRENVLANNPTAITTDDPELQASWRQHRDELAEWDREFERQTGKYLWHKV